MARVAGRARGADVRHSVSGIGAGPPFHVERVSCARPFGPGRRPDAVPPGRRSRAAVPCRPSGERAGRRCSRAAVRGGPTRHGRPVVVVPVIGVGVGVGVGEGVGVGVGEGAGIGVGVGEGVGEGVGVGMGKGAVVVVGGAGEGSRSAPRFGHQLFACSRGSTWNHPDRHRSHPLADAYAARRDRFSPAPRGTPPHRMEQHRPRARGTVRRSTGDPWPAPPVRPRGAARRARAACPRGAAPPPFRRSLAVPRGTAPRHGFHEREERSTRAVP